MKSEIIPSLTVSFEGHEVGDHFADFGRMVALGSGSRCEIDDISRHLEQKAECSEWFTLCGRVA